MRRKVILLFLSIALSVPMMGQRLAVHSNFVGIELGTNFYSGAATIDYGHYFSSGFLETKVSFAHVPMVSKQNSRYSYAPIQVHAGYMFRIYSTRSKIFNVYGGGGLSAGMEVADVFKQLPQGEEPSFKSHFIYGLYPQVLAEWFFYKNIALTANVFAPFTINSAKNWFNIDGLVGLKFNF